VRVFGLNIVIYLLRPFSFANFLLLFPPAQETSLLEVNLFEKYVHILRPTISRHQRQWEELYENFVWHRLTDRTCVANGLLPSSLAIIPRSIGVRELLLLFPFLWSHCYSHPFSWQHLIPVIPFPFPRYHHSQFPFHFIVICTILK